MSILAKIRPYATISKYVKKILYRFEISSLPEVLYKRGDLKNFSKFIDKHKKKSSGVALLKIILKILQNSQKRSVFFNKAAGWIPKNFRGSHWRFSVKKVFLKRMLVFQNQALIDPLQNKCYWIILKIHLKNPVLEALFDKSCCSENLQLY